MNRRTVDAAVAVGAAAALVVGSMAAAAGQPKQLDGIGFALIVLAGLALAWRRTAPVATVVATVLVDGVYLLLGYPYGPIQLAMMLAIFELARLRPVKVSAPVTAAAALVSVAAVLPRFLGGAIQTPALLAVLWTAWQIVPWSLGALVAANAHSRKELLLRGALEERMRLAAEVHDVAGHGFAVIAMQAGVAEVVFDERPDQVRESLAAIRETSQRALDELRANLGNLRGESLPDVRGLVERVRAGGLPVELAIDVPDLPPALATVAYRVVQESLTNVLRHADAAPASVRLAAVDEDLLVEIIDQGTTTAEPVAGQGLTGMRSRVEAAGGELTAGPVASGGFRVRARLPLS